MYHPVSLWRFQIPPKGNDHYGNTPVSEHILKVVACSFSFINLHKAVVVHSNDHRKLALVEKVGTYLYMFNLFNRKEYKRRMFGSTEVWAERLHGGGQGRAWTLFFSDAHRAWRKDGRCAETTGYRGVKATDDAHHQGFLATLGQTFHKQVPVHH